jgi:hypothetical protein
MRPTPPPIPAQRVRAIARHELRPDALPRVSAELEMLAAWLDTVHPPDAHAPEPAPERAGLRVVR